MKYVFENGGITWWNGYCPFCAAKNHLLIMKKNVHGNFVCTRCEIQIYPDENTKRAVILKTRGERRFPDLEYSSNSDFYLRDNNLVLILCPQRYNEHPYHSSNDGFTVVKELEKYVFETRKSFI